MRLSTIYYTEVNFYQERLEDKEVKYEIKKQLESIYNCEQDDRLILVLTEAIIEIQDLLDIHFKMNHIINIINTLSDRSYNILMDAIENNIDNLENSKNIAIKYLFKIWKELVENAENYKIDKELINKFCPNTILDVPILTKEPNALQFKLIGDNEIDVNYGKGHLDTYRISNKKDFIIDFFKDLAKANNGVIEGLEERLDKIDEYYGNDSKFLNIYDRNDIDNILGTQNIVKKVCAELGITQKELAEELGMKPTALSNWANGDIPQIAQKALELLLENKKLKENFKILKKAHKILSE